MDAEFILVYNDSKNLQEILRISWEMTIFPKGTQNGRFRPKCKGGTLCKILEIGRFLGWTSQASKNRKYLSDFSLIGMDGRGIYSSL